MTPRSRSDSSGPSSPGSTGSAGSTSGAVGAVLAASRVRFLTSEELDGPRVRPAILASWQRSREAQVLPDKIDMRYVRDIDLDTQLIRSADRVLRRLSDQLDGQPVSIVLTDPTGLVLSRQTADADLERQLDRVLLAPGFSYAERFVGTNGIGTALESGAATRVFGHEHYAEDLEELACAGVPIHHPLTGRIVGAVDLTCWRKDAAFLLLTLAKSTAHQIREALLADSNPHELELFHAYLRTCRRLTGIVFAITDNLVMINDHARAMLDPVDQSALLTRAREDLLPGKQGSVLVQLPSGITARMHAQQVQAGSRLSGIVVQVKLGELKPASPGATEPGRPDVSLPGLVGTSPVWLRACHEVERAFRSGEWLALEGEPGVGKLALLRAVQLRRQPVGRLAVLDAVAAATNPHWVKDYCQPALASADNVVIQHIDQLDAPKLRALTAALRDARGRQRPLWVALTIAEGSQSVQLDELIRLIPATVGIPPLRMHLEDLDALVAFFLARSSHGAHVTCSPESMRLLHRSSWPGNVEQLHQLLRQVLTHRRSGVIEPRDLPPVTQTVSRRLLSTLESMERDAIVHSLTDSAGNKVKAAQSLGMSRATIYRKIHEYGIVATD